MTKMDANLRLRPPLVRVSVALVWLCVIYVLAGAALPVGGQATGGGPDPSSCPLSLQATPSPDCEPQITARSGLESSKCCLEALTNFSQSLATYCNRTGTLFLETEEEQSCASEAVLRGLIDTHTCSIFPPAFTADSTGSKCYFHTIRQLQGALSDEGSGSTLASVDAACQDMLGADADQSCSTCHDTFLSATTSLQKWAHDDLDESACGAALLVAFSSLHAAQLDRMQPFYDCVHLPFLTATALQGGKGNHRARRLEFGTFVLVIVIILTVISTAAAGLAYCRYRHHGGKDGKPARKLTAQGTETEESESMRDSSAVPGDRGGREIIENDGLYTFSAKELLRATDNYSEGNLLGEGSAGRVFRGVLPSGQLVAVKKIDKEKQRDTFKKEVDNLSKVRHKNLCTLLGLCQAGDEHLLVYEYCSKGNLSELLFGSGPPLTWEQRIHIAVGTARGIWFLHLYPGGYIVHRDIKPTNILLNENMVPKVSDFGLSRFIAIDESSVFTAVRGTTGYMDPEYYNGGTLTFASDVYSLGVVLLQLISGRRPMYNFGLEGQYRFSLVKAGAHALAEDNLDALVDPKVKGVYAVQAYQKMLETAVACTQAHSHDRPTMNEVLQALEEAWELAKESSPLRPPQPDTSALVVSSTSTPISPR